MLLDQHHRTHLHHWQQGGLLVSILQTVKSTVLGGRLSTLPVGQSPGEYFARCDEYSAKREVDNRAKMEVGYIAIRRSPGQYFASRDKYSASRGLPT